MSKKFIVVELKEEGQVSKGGFEVINKDGEAFGEKRVEHIEEYGEGNGKRLTGKHEPCSVYQIEVGTSAKDDFEVIQKDSEAAGEKREERIMEYGEGNDKRPIGKHETCSIDRFEVGAAVRGASIRSPRTAEASSRDMSCGEFYAMACSLQAVKTTSFSRLPLFEGVLIASEQEVFCKEIHGEQVGGKFAKLRDLWNSIRALGAGPHTEREIGEQFARLAGCKLENGCLHAMVQRLAEKGHITVDGDAVRLTVKGVGTQGE